MHIEKHRALLTFLKEAAVLRRKRVSAYGKDDKTLWLGQLSKDYLEIRSIFFAENPEEFSNSWLELCRKRKPIFPPIPEIVGNWLPQEFLDNPKKYLSKKAEELIGLLRSRITILVEKPISNPDLSTLSDTSRVEKIAEERRLKDYPEVEEAWLEYVVEQWEPWTQEMAYWKEVQRIYEEVDFMRRRIEEVEERYELLLGVGLLQWKDPTGTTIKRHILTAPAEITLEPERGILTVAPAASFEKFRVELDMLEPQYQPSLKNTDIEERLEDLDIQVWNTSKIGEILRVIANHISPNAEVDENQMAPLKQTDETPRVVYAPALVLRERRPTAYEELISQFLKGTEEKTSLNITAPWKHFISEGEPPEDSENLDYPENCSLLNDTRLYFPLPRNEEQKKIAESLKERPYVLVKGPPGTGKSHTIANLICHLLAKGDRILVTAQKPKALSVLREKLPDSIQGLSVTFLGTSSEDQHFLAESVRRIIQKINEWKGAEWAQQKIAELEKELRQLEDRIAEIDRNLREICEAETYFHTLPGDYQGTMAQIARTVKEKRQKYAWFPELDVEKECPLSGEEIYLLAEVHSQLTSDRLKELNLNLGNISLPDPKKFRELIHQLEDTEKLTKAACKGIKEEHLSLFQTTNDELLSSCQVFLEKLEEYTIRASRVLGKSTEHILSDLLIGQDARWQQLVQHLSKLLQSMEAATKKLGHTQVKIPPEISVHQLLIDAQRRLQHLQKGRWKGWGFIAPRIMRETRYIENSCLVDSQSPKIPEQFEKLVAFLELKIAIKEFSEIWATFTSLDDINPLQVVIHLREVVQELTTLLEFIQNSRKSLGIVPVAERVNLAQKEERQKWLALIKAEIAEHKLAKAYEPFKLWLNSLRQTIALGNVHPCVERFIKAIETRNIQEWETAWELLKQFEEEKKQFHSYKELLNRIGNFCPALKELLISTQGLSEWKSRLLQLQEAWAWAYAKTWLRKVTNSESYESLLKERNTLQKKVEKKIEEIATVKAWHAFFSRLDEATSQNLIAWTKAIARIGKGTGKYAYRHRKSARKYLMRCIPKIPAWIMPLHKLWETVKPVSGLFDTIIIDEASQAGVESLVLLLLAKRIIVVGDDQQNSPEAVGILEEDIARLAREHLRNFQFRSEFRPDTSLYDHAERAFGNVISLREHFRCVPEIIRFSNELCYSDAPLIPLRQPPSKEKRLPPLISVFVKNGTCEGRGARLINRAEAETIVKKIKECIEDPAYAGKTMGVIILQGHLQAEVIDQMLAEVFEPKVRAERKLQCGTPATFQGDQRDIIFLSLVVAPNYQFRALTGLNDKRRFNVAMSRAHDQVWLFHSVQLHDLSPLDLRYQLLKFFSTSKQTIFKEHYEELERLEHEAKNRIRQPRTQPEPYDSWFEVDVAMELMRRGYFIRPQYEAAGYRIDLVIEGLNARLAVECDGEYWHGPDRYDYDMARQRQLERVGWKFVRIRESEFYINRKKAIQKVIEACEDLGIKPLKKTCMSFNEKESKIHSIKAPQENLEKDKFTNEEKLKLKTLAQQISAVDNTSSELSTKYENHNFSDPFNNLLGKNDVEQSNEKKVSIIKLTEKEAYTREWKKYLESFLSTFKEFKKEGSKETVPDAYIFKYRGNLVIVLNDEHNSILNQSYIQNKEKEVLKKNAWFIKSPNQKQKTLYKIIESVVKFQKVFFEKGIAYLKPLTLKDVANDIGVHESTVSRIISNRYISTPFGIFELKYFFTSSISTYYGDQVSSESIKMYIKNLIEEEDPKNPLSDQKIVELLKDKWQINIARRTVAKYRETLGIPSSSKRKV